MSGNRYLLDTNAIIALLQKDSNLVQLLQNAERVISAKTLLSRYTVLLKHTFH